MIPESVKQVAIELRIEHRLGLKEICRRTGLSSGSASKLLRAYPLTEEEIRGRLAANGRMSASRRAMPQPALSKHAEVVAGLELTRQQKGQIAESAILFRLALRGLEVWKAQYDGCTCDWLVCRPRGRKHVRLQVRWAKRETLRGQGPNRERKRCGRPLVSLRKSGGRGLVSAEECDFVIGYDLETDTAFVIPIEAVEGKKKMCSCAAAYAEAWSQLRL